MTRAPRPPRSGVARHWLRACTCSGRIARIHPLLSRWGSRRLPEYQYRLPRARYSGDRRTAELAALASKRTARSALMIQSLDSIVLVFSGALGVARRTQPPVPFPPALRARTASRAVLRGRRLYPKAFYRSVARIPPNTFATEILRQRLLGAAAALRCRPGLGCAATSCDPTTVPVSTWLTVLCGPQESCVGGSHRRPRVQQPGWLHACSTNGLRPRTPARQPALRRASASRRVRRRVLCCRQVRAESRPGAPCEATSQCGRVHASPALALEPTAARRVPRAGRYLWATDVTDRACIYPTAATSFAARHPPVPAKR